VSLFSKTGPRVQWHDQGEQEGHVTMVDEQPGLAETESREVAHHD
jgi:hypothetical protein